VATEIPYDASDGQSVTVGDIKVRNAMAISKDGVDVSLVMVVVNGGTSTEVVTFAYGFDESSSTTNAAASQKSVTVTVEAGQSISFGAGEDGGQLLLTDANAELGALMPLFVQYGDETGKIVRIPVLDNSLPGYEDLLPTTPATPKPDATAKPPVD
jgi:hypothetical protein